VTEIPLRVNGTPGGEVDKFRKLGSEQRGQVLAAMQATGARAVISAFVPQEVALGEWIQLAQSSYYLHWLWARHRGRGIPLDQRAAGCLVRRDKPASRSECKSVRPAKAGW
jgi:hypothetical protein